MHNKIQDRELILKLTHKNKSLLFSFITDMYALLCTLRLKFVSYITAVAKQAIARLFKANYTGQYASCMKANSYLKNNITIVQFVITSLKATHHSSRSFLFLTFILSPLCVKLLFADCIMIRDIHAIRWAWYLLGLCKLPATMYASPIVSSL